MSWISNGLLYPADIVSPSKISWDTTRYTDGAYDLTAFAYDNAKNIGESSNIIVCVNNPNDTIPPAVSVTMTSGYSNFGGNYF